MKLSRLAMPLALFALAGEASGPAAAADAELEYAILATHEAGELERLHGLHVSLGGEVLVDLYFSGDDERWGAPLGVRDHGPTTLHDIRSITKSIVGLLYGVALADGKVPELGASLVAQFPDYPDLVNDPERAKIRVRDALAMTMGTQWDESSLPYTDPRNSEIAMELASDRYRYALERPLVAAPGQTWTYNGGAVALIAKLIADGVGKPIDAYAADVLFDPLGIDTVEWVRGADGEPSAASGLRLSAHDLAKIGRMIAGGGLHEGRRVVPEDWLRLSFTPWSQLDGIRYGYLWWLADWGDPPGWVAGIGNGGQRLSVQPELDLVVVIFAGRYNEPDAWKLPVGIIEKFIAPRVRDRLR